MSNPMKFIITAYPGQTKTYFLAQIIPGYFIFNSLASVLNVVRWRKNDVHWLSYLVAQYDCAYALQV